MSKLITDEIAEQTKQQFTELDEPVRLLLFTQPHACGACAEQHELLESLAGLSDKLSLEVYSLGSPEATEYRIDKVPATVVRGEIDYGIRFFGLTGGYEFSSLLEAIQRVSLGVTTLDATVVELGSIIDVPTHIEVMVTLACPYCQKMVGLVHQLAMANDHVSADMVDSSEFPQLVNRYQVSGVPLTVVNGQRGFEGALSAQQMILSVLKMVAPETYESVDAKMRDAQGLRHAHEAITDELYDVIVVGAGPAGLTAALYAQRKGRKTALIGKQAGGQINETEVIENYPGLMQVGGAELAQAMRHHVEAYAVAERCHTQVVSIEHNDGLFKLRTEDEQEYRGRSVIYCTGKRNRYLNVPGEERFTGRGIAWCATCDAPLYKGKQVAVVGGGNSAFTAIRDLVRYADKIHLIHISDEFQADPVLIGQIRRAEVDGIVQFHLNSQIREFLGRDQLEGIRLAGAAGEVLEDLAVQGVFLEIGLEPNSALLAKLLTLNENDEVPVERDQSTAVAGLFAAGDVTDETDKQIVISAGAGAKAALAADRYLSSIGI
jgi:alkyl hydroperoxide reductase subunit F